jgi:hypothetical protein
MNQKRIVIDGKVYNSVDEMPEDIRQKYTAAMRNLDLDKDRNGTMDMLENVNAFFEDKNKDGVPDAFDGLVSNSNVITSTRIVADGKEYNGMEDLPPEVRAKLSQAMGQLDANRNGIPDFLEGTANTPNQTANVVSAFGTETPRRTQPIQAPAIEPEPASSGWMIALAGLFLFMFCLAGAAAVWFFFLR